MLPAPAGSSWLTVYRDMSKGDLGVMLSATRNTIGEVAMESVIQDWEVVGPALGGNARVFYDQKYKREKIGESHKFGDLKNPDIRRAGFEWLAERVNTFINVLSPRVRDIVEDQADRGRSF